MSTSQISVWFESETSPQTWFQQVFDYLENLQADLSLFNLPTHNHKMTLWSFYRCMSTLFSHHQHKCFSYIYSLIQQLIRIIVCNDISRSVSFTILLALNSPTPITHFFISIKLSMPLNWPPQGSINGVRKTLFLSNVTGQKLHAIDGNQIKFCIGSIIVGVLPYLTHYSPWSCLRQSSMSIYASTTNHVLDGG